MSVDDDRLSVYAEALADELALRCAPPARDFADVLARAQAQRDEPLPASLREGLEDDPVDADDVVDEPDPALAVFAEALRQRHESKLRDRELAPIPAPRRAPARWPWAVAVAAAIVLAFVLVPRLSPTAVEAGDDAVHSEAERSAEGAMRGQAESRAVQRQPVAPHRAGPTQDTTASDVIETPDLDEAEAEGETEVDASVDEPATRRRAVRPRVSLDDLEAQARAAWKRGELAEAERLFREVIRRSKDRGRTELVYGDLFSLAKQRYGASGQAKVWREYVRKYPRGRFSDDARAGLCRRAPADAQADCWADYLTAHPDGTHAEAARRIVADRE